MSVKTPNVTQKVPNKKAKYFDGFLNSGLEAKRPLSPPSVSVITSFTEIVKRVAFTFFFFEPAIASFFFFGIGPIMATLVSETFPDASLGLRLYPVLLEYPGGTRVVTISACMVTSTNPLDKAMLVQAGDIAVSVASTIDGRAVSLICENTAEGDDGKQRSLEESFEAYVSTIGALKPPRRLVVYRLRRPVLLDAVARIIHGPTPAATATAAAVVVTSLTEAEATVLVDAHYEPDATSDAGTDAAVPLPAGWRSAVDAASGRTYYYNEVRAAICYMSTLRVSLTSKSIGNRSHGSRSLRIRGATRTSSLRPPWPPRAPCPPLPSPAAAAAASSAVAAAAAAKSAAAAAAAAAVPLARGTNPTLQAMPLVVEAAAVAAAVVSGGGDAVVARRAPPGPT